MFQDFYETPCRIVRAGERTELFLRARYSQRQFDAQKNPLKLQMIANAGLLADGTPANWDEWDEIPFKLDGGKLLYTVNPDREGEIAFRLMSGAENLAEWSLYALEKDLFGTGAYRGDLHVHSSFSECGTRDENPCFVAAMGRKYGLDFLAVTDHLQQEASLLAKEFAGEAGTELQVYPGEEVHALIEPMPSLFCINRFYPHNHIVSIGASEGVAAWVNGHFEEYQREVRHRAAAIPGSDAEQAKYTMAVSDWIFDKIHELGGFAVFCHPFWRPQKRLNLPENVREYILKQNKFDALELTALAGARQSPDANEANFRNLARYEEACIRMGKRIPVVGNTDSHQTGYDLGYQYSLVFAQSPKLEDVTRAIREGRSVAATHYPGHALNLYGDSRLVSYGYFLEREVMPEHDEKCRADGLRMLALLREK